VRDVCAAHDVEPSPCPLPSKGRGERKPVKSRPRVVRTKNFVADAAAFILEQARKAMADRNEFRIALSGGNTPAPVYARIEAEARDFPWDRVRFTFGDERCVPPDDPQSNFKMARENLFIPAAVPEKSIMRMRGEIDPQIAAQEYEDQLDAIATEGGERIYQHDLILLGLGDDGHTASLFPGTAALDEMTRRVVANFVPKLNAWRLTFTFPLINHARHILFLVGASKSPQLIERVLAGDEQFPAARVNPSAGEVTWMIGES
jgi:6-phosphogluconolactonase